MHSVSGFLLYVPLTPEPEPDEVSSLIEAGIAAQPAPELEKDPEGTGVFSRAALEPLYVLAVCRAPIDAAGLAFVLAGRSPTGQETTEAESILEWWIARGLAWRVGTGFAWVPRGIAEGLRARLGEVAWREFCRRVGDYRIWRLENLSHGLRDAVEAVRLFLDARAFGVAGERALEALEFMAPHDRPAELASFAEEVMAGLPEQDVHFPAICRRAGEARLALGDNVPALEHFRREARVLQETLELEPERHDLKRALSGTLLKVGEALRRLGEGEAARLQVLRALGMRERALLLEPDRAEAQRDVWEASVALGDVLLALGDEANAGLHFLRALRILEALGGDRRSEPGSST